VIDKVRRYHEQFGHSVLHLRADAGGLIDAQHRASLELFQSGIAATLRRDICDPGLELGELGAGAARRRRGNRLDPDGGRCRPGR
jgi:hypothetical protein